MMDNYKYKYHPWKGILLIDAFEIYYIYHIIKVKILDQLASIHNIIITIKHIED